MSLRKEDAYLACIINDINGSQPYVGDVVRFSAGTVSTLSCLIVIAALFYHKLHGSFNYRLITYWLTAYVLISFAHAISLCVGWYEAAMAPLCQAIAALDTYCLWVLMIISLFIALVMVSMAVCSVQLKVLEIPSVLASLLLPLAFFWIPILTKTYGYTPYYGCWIRNLNDSCNQTQIGSNERIGLWYIPVFAQVLLVCASFFVVTFALAFRWWKERVSYSSDERESLLSSHSSHYTALKEIVILFGCPVVTLAAIFTFLALVVLNLSRVQQYTFWLQTILSIAPDISGLVAAASVGVHLLVVHMKKGKCVGMCSWCCKRKTSIQLATSCADKSTGYGSVNDSYPTQYEPPTESEVDSALESGYHQH